MGIWILGPEKRPLIGLKRWVLRACADFACSLRILYCVFACGGVVGDCFSSNL